MPVLQIDGSLSTRRRDEVLAKFHQPHNNVLLMTLGTGAVGFVSSFLTPLWIISLVKTYTNTKHCRLNLTVANRVHIIEPQWNPTVESQAIGRVMRIGQQKQVYVTRYIVKNSIEEVCVSSIAFPDSLFPRHAPSDWQN
jgi:SNF2 family DNA or RNA helicase